MAEITAALGASHSLMLVCTLQDWQRGFRSFDPKGSFFDRQGNEMRGHRLVGYFEPDDFAEHLRSVLANQ